jgi:hypothetical protein
MKMPCATSSASVRVVSSHAIIKSAVPTVPSASEPAAPRKLRTTTAVRTTTTAAAAAVDTAAAVITTASKKKNCYCRPK